MKGVSFIEHLLFRPNSIIYKIPSSNSAQLSNSATRYKLQNQIAGCIQRESIHSRKIKNQKNQKNHGRIIAHLV